MFTKMMTSTISGSRYLALCALLPLAGCVSYGSSEAVKSLPADVAANGYISAIEIKAMPPNATPEFQAKLDAALHAATAKCATGKHALRLEVKIGRFAPQNAALTILAGDSNIIRGSAQIVDPDSGTVLGDYDIDRSTGGGGILAAIGQAGAEGQMADSFASEVCNQAFHKH